VDVTELTHPRRERGVVEVVHAALIEKMAKHPGRLLALACLVADSRFLVSRSQRDDLGADIACLKESEGFVAENERVARSVEQPHVVPVRAVVRRELQMTF